jgi:hypothetical protein
MTVSAWFHELGDGRPGHGSDLDEVELGILGQSQRFADRHDADLLTLGSDQTDLGDTDTVVDAGLGDGLSSAAAWEESLAHPGAGENEGPGSFRFQGPLTGGARTGDGACTARGTDRWPEPRDPGTWAS